MACRRHLVLPLSCLLLVGLGCGAEGEDAAGASPFTPPDEVLGGQTGALSRLCGPAPQAAQGEAVPGGSSGIVVYTDGCGSAELLGSAESEELTLLDAAGRAVDFEIERLSGGATLIRPRQPLLPGTYTVRGPGLEPTQVMVAAEPERLPMRLGQLSQVAACDPTFHLAVDDAVLDYLPQLRLAVAVDGAQAVTWFDYGTLQVTGAMAFIELERCFPTCLDDGRHELTLTAELAGELGTLEPISTPFDVLCEPPPSSDDGCSISSARGARAPPRALWVALALLGLALWRRRCARP